MMPLTTSDKRREWGSNPCESDESPDLKTGALATLPSLHNQILSLGLLYVSMKGFI